MYKKIIICLKIIAGYRGGGGFLIENLTHNMRAFLGTNLTHNIGAFCGETSLHNIRWGPFAG